MGGGVTWGWAAVTFVRACVYVCVCTKESTWVQKVGRKGGSKGRGRRRVYKFKSIHRIQKKSKIKSYVLSFLLLLIACGDLVSNIIIV